MTRWGRVHERTRRHVHVAVIKWQFCQIDCRTTCCKSSASEPRVRETAARLALAKEGLYNCS